MSDTYDQPSKFQPSYHPLSHMITIQILGNHLTSTTFAASCSHIITICYPSCQLPTNKSMEKWAGKVASCSQHFFSWGAHYRRWDTRDIVLHNMFALHQPTCIPGRNSMTSLCSTCPSCSIQAIWDLQLPVGFPTDFASGKWTGSHKSVMWGSCLMTCNFHLMIATKTARIWLHWKFRSWLLSNCLFRKILLFSSNTKSKSLKYFKKPSSFGANPLPIARTSKEN